MFLLLLCWYWKREPKKKHEFEKFVCGEKKERLYRKSLTQLRKRNVALVSLWSVSNKYYIVFTSFFSICIRLKEQFFSGFFFHCFSLSYKCNFDGVGVVWIVISCVWCSMKCEHVSVGAICSKSGWFLGRMCVFRDFLSLYQRNWISNEMIFVLYVWYIRFQIHQVANIKCLLVILSLLFFSKISLESHQIQ